MFEQGADLDEAKIRKKMTPAEKHEHFLHKTVIWGKMVKVSYSQEQGFRVFLEKLKVRLVRSFHKYQKEVVMFRSWLSSVLMIWVNYLESQ